MTKDADHEWQLQITSLIAEVKVNQENLHEKLKNYCGSSNQRIEKLEKIVIGNGIPGLGEEVRSLKGKWAAVFGLLILILSAVINYAVDNAFASKVKIIDNRPAIQMAVDAALKSK